MLKKFQKLLVVLFAVAIVVSIAVVPVNACTLDGDGTDGIYPEFGGYYTYAADAWAYCSDSPFWCYVYSTAGYDWQGGDAAMGDGTARAYVAIHGLSYAAASSYTLIDYGFGCHC